MTRTARSRHAMRLAAAAAYRAASATAARAGDRGRAAYFAALGRANVGRAAAIREHAAVAPDRGAPPGPARGPGTGR